MSSIAYVTDNKMLEYHRLCCNRNILFWRLTTKNKFTDFQPGDLLFFYARPNVGKRRAFVGYGHYQATRKLTINQMWTQYGQTTGYDDKAQLVEAITKAAKGEVPRSMLCLILTDVVFFSAPVLPKEVGLEFPANLESYTYIDKDDPKVTLKILQTASRFGIDLWSKDPTSDPEEVFLKDEIRHILALAHQQAGKDNASAKELSTSKKLAKEKASEEGWELVRGSQTDCFKFASKKIYIAIPYTYNSTDESRRMISLLGKMMLYKVQLRTHNITNPIRFIALHENDEAELETMVKNINAEL